MRRLLLPLLLAGCTPRQAQPSAPPAEAPAPPFLPKGPWLRVGVGQARSFRVQAPGTLWVFVGERGERALPPGEYRVRLRRFKEGKFSYHVLVARYPTEAAANEALFRLLGEGYERAYVKTLGRRWGEADAREWGLWVGPFRSLREAKRGAPRPYLWILKLYDEPPSGRVELLKGKRVLVAAEGRLRLWSSKPLKLKGRSYPGFLEFIPWERKLVAVNVVQAEDYVAGVLPWEMGPEYPLEALKAQAVLARTHALWASGKKARLIGAPYDLTDDQFTQIYKGVVERGERIARAVRETQGFVLVWGDRLIRAPFHSSSGGYTEAGEAVWGEPCPGTIAKPEGPGRVDSLDIKAFIDEPPPCWSDPGHAPPALRDWARATFRWRVRRSKSKWARVIEKATGRRVGKLKALRVKKRGPGGRALELEVVGSAGRFTLRGEYNIRRALGGLKSAFFYVVDRGSSIEIRGGGFGHGAGLSQLGAAGMAQAGKNYVQILRNYFEGVRIVKLW